MTYHNPVLLKECIKGLNINPDGIYVDVTFGGGGHSKKILEQQKISFESHSMPDLDHSIDIRGIKAAQNFIKKLIK